MSADAPKAGVHKFEALAAACCDPRLSRGDLAVLAVILRHLNNQTGAAFPGVNKVAVDARLDRRSVIRGVQHLESLGFIEVERGAKGKSNRYRPSAPSSGVYATSDTHATSDGCVTQLVAPVSPEVVTPVSPELRLKQLRKSEPRKSRADALDEQGFVEFWDAYPKRVDKIDAKKIWRKLNAEDRAAAIADVKRRNTGEWAGKALIYILGPARYLRGRRWEDEVPPKQGSTKPPGQLASDFDESKYLTGAEEVA